MDEQQDSVSDWLAAAFQPTVIACGTGVAIALLTKWDAVVFRTLAHQFYEQSAVAVLREPSQIALSHYLAMVWLAFPIALAIAGRRLAPHARCWILIMAIAYAVRGSIWIAGSNLPLVPGDSCHYVEIASSILQGEGPVKHYVESFFRDYPAIRRNEGVLDDWATPLYSYILAGCYRVLRIVPGDSIEATFAVAKGLSFSLSLAALPALYFFARRNFGPATALQSMALLAVLPVHALYAGMELRESLVVLTTLLAVGAFLEMHRPSGTRFAWAIMAGLFMGLAILSRNTAMATAAACALYGIGFVRPRALAALVVWGIVTLCVISPWAWLTYREYGHPFYTYTQYFAYNFSWAVHHYQPGNMQPSEFLTSANLPEILRTKTKALAIIVSYSAMIISLPLFVGFIRRLKGGSIAWDRLAALVAVAFVGGTLVGTADVTQVMQLGRYYVPLFVLMIPSAIAGLGGLVSEGELRRPLAAATLVALLWADPTWAYDFNWLSRSYQLHWPALRSAGEWVRAHPEAVPTDARIVTYFPWEFRLASRRPTILMNRSLYAPHIEQTIRAYEATHVLWGSFEPQPDVDPELMEITFAQTRSSLGLNATDELYRSPAVWPTGLYPVTLYRIDRDRR